MTGAEKMREAAAKLIERKVQAYVEEHGTYDPSTGVTEFPGDGDEWVGEMEEFVDEIRALPTPAPAQDVAALVDRLRGQEGIPNRNEVADALAAIADERDRAMQACEQINDALDVEKMRNAQLFDEAHMLREAALRLKRIVEEIDGAMNHGIWRDQHGARLKDTPEWVKLYNALTARGGAAP